MNWEAFYLGCFIVGLALSAVSLLGGMGHIGHVHVPHVPHAVHVPHVPHLAHAPHAPHVAAAGAGLASSSHGVPWWNAFSVMVFITWFGAAGYLLTRHGSFIATVVLLLSVLAGIAGGAIVFLFLTKVLLPHERELTAEQTAVEGVVGRVSAPIRSGVGEVIYEQLGARRSVPARSDDGSEIAKNEEVFVVRYEKGIAWVRRWEDMPELAGHAQSNSTSISHQQPGAAE